MQKFEHAVKKETIFGESYLPKNKQDIFHIAMSGTDNYLVHLGVTMTSMLMHNPGEKFHFHVFINGISDEDLGKMKMLSEEFQTCISLYFVNDDVFRDMLHRDGIAAHFYRFMIQPVLAGKAERVLCTDGDILCQRPLRPLITADLSGNTAAAVRDTSKEYEEMRRKRVGTSLYFNAGVLLIDIQEWNRQELSEKAADMAEQRHRSGRPLASHDQDILNVLLDRQVKMMDPKYNDICNLDRKTLWKKQFDLTYNPEAVLVHYAGIVKPWKSWVQYLDCVKPYREAWLRSPWRDIPLQEPKGYKNLHQAARHARKKGDYPEMFSLYRQYFLAKLHHER